MRELSISNLFVDWTMTLVQTVTYKFNVNDVYTPMMVAKRGIRQGGLVFPLLFVLVMEYLTRYLQTLENDHHFQFHSRCSKLKISSLNFADDLLLFTRGDNNFVDAMLDCFYRFSKSTGLRVNNQKCSIYFGAVDEHTKLGILQKNWFQGGQPSFQCLALPKAVTQRVDAVCRSFIWSGNSSITRKSPVAWKQVCSPKENGGLNLMDLTMAVKSSFSWIMKTVLKQRDEYQVVVCNLQMNKFRSKEVYSAIKNVEPRVP
ncbi:uncharacterized protein LOC131631205 [Vicia villosa]|uniref:uncharacterized protein LOC131631205 n=1 Tax=Vicia villosa TaxID=3911 RepID=UPI00273AF21E|nr:uncharacterized protein LOC131631205 [Vicia villosa]